MVLLLLELPQILQHLQPSDNLPRLAPRLRRPPHLDRQALPQLSDKQVLLPLSVVLHNLLLRLGSLHLVAGRPHLHLDRLQPQHLLLDPHQQQQQLHPRSENHLHSGNLPLDKPLLPLHSALPLLPVRLVRQHNQRPPLDKPRNPNLPSSNLLQVAHSLLSRVLVQQRLELQPHLVLPQKIRGRAHLALEEDSGLSQAHNLQHSASLPAVQVRHLPSDRLPRLLLLALSQQYLPLDNLLLLELHPEEEEPSLAFKLNLKHHPHLDRTPLLLALLSHPILLRSVLPRQQQRLHLALRNQQQPLRHSVVPQHQ